MARYYRADPAYWDQVKPWREDRKKLLGIYLKTCKHRNLEGFYHLPKAYIAADLDWSPKVVSANLSWLRSEGFCLYDEKAEVVLLPDVLAEQAPSTEKQLAGALNALERIPPNSLWNHFLIACESHCPSLSNEIRNRFGIAPESNGNIARTHSSSSNSNSGVQT